ncbi:uncharacterized protein LOC122571522 isoform X2 [Bombus pyrosoma]|uniref:uncharacterized protein LOC122571522 isoform X2 n=1 Tax=Bombus pyrosoma TaxID=396416 RepID=UPI001CB89D45|nr:uncharacterized protein LOC122571522 isoform X2 [Bombus pyrosoma]
MNYVYGWWKSICKFKYLFGIKNTFFYHFIIMSSKMSSARKAVATRSNKNTVESNHHLPTSGLSYDCNKLLEITVKTKGRKRTSTMVSSSPTSHKVEEKKKPGHSGDQNWGRVFREQNKAVMKQEAKRAPGSKSSKHGNDTKETKKHFLNHQKLDHKFLDEIPVKQSTPQKRIEEHIKSTPYTTNPSSTSIPSTVESVIVYDRGVQCDGVSDYSDDKFGVFNPVHTLHFLIKELEHLVKDDKANKILADMEQVVFRIPIESSKPPIVDLEAKLETTRQMNSMYEALRKERDSLLRQVHEQQLLLNETQKRQLDLEVIEKTLKQELDKTIKVIQARDKTISELTEEMKNYESSQKIVAELRTNLAEQTERVRQLNSEVKHLTLEKDKLSVLSSYKHSLLIEHLNEIKKVQHFIADQLKDIYIHEDNSNPQIPIVHGRRACSSPTSTSSPDSNIRTSWHDISDVSLSTVDHDPSKIKHVQGFLHKSNKIPVFSETQIGNLENKQVKDVQDPSIKDSANLEFISLPAGESSLTLLPSYKDLGCTEVSQYVNQGKDDVVTFSNKKNDNLKNFKDTNKVSSSEHLNLPNKKAHEKETDVQESNRIKKSMESNKGQSSPHNLIGSNITEQFQNIVEDIRMQSKMPVNIPSPLRSYPHPEWSDSTLPTISTASDINVI